MANDVRVRVTLACTECKQRNYDTMKNKKSNPTGLRGESSANSAASTRFTERPSRAVIK